MSDEPNIDPGQVAGRAEATSSAFAAGPWQKGPANGGAGTAGEKGGVSQWYDGDLLMILVETTGGREIAVVRISCDEDWFSVTDASTGDEYDAWDPEQWAWWALINEAPPLKPNDQAHLRQPYHDSRKETK